MATTRTTRTTQTKKKTPTPAKRTTKKEEPRRCVACGEVKPRSAFYERRNRNGYLEPTCRTCESARRRANLAISRAGTRQQRTAAATEKDQQAEPTTTTELSCAPPLKLGEGYFLVQPDQEATDNLLALGYKIVHAEMQERKWGMAVRAVGDDGAHYLAGLIKSRSRTGHIALWPETIAEGDSPWDALELCAVLARSHFFAPVMDVA